MTQRIAFTVTGDIKLHCTACEQRVERALRRLSGVQAVKATLDTQQVFATIDSSQVSPAQVEQRLTDLGYEVAAD